MLTKKMPLNIKDVEQILFDEASKVKTMHDFNHIVDPIYNDSIFIKVYKELKTFSGEDANQFYALHETLLYTGMDIEESFPEVKYIQEFCDNKLKPLQEDLHNSGMLNNGALDDEENKVKEAMNNLYDIIHLASDHYNTGVEERSIARKGVVDILEKNKYKVMNAFAKCEKEVYINFNEENKYDN